MNKWIKKLISPFVGESKQSESHIPKGDWRREWQELLKPILSKRSNNIEDYVSHKGCYYNLIATSTKLLDKTKHSTEKGILSRWETLNIMRPLCSDSEAFKIAFWELCERETEIYGYVRERILQIVDSDIRIQLWNKADSSYICDSTKTPEKRYNYECEFLPDSPLNLRAIQNICVRRKEEIGNEGSKSQGFKNDQIQGFMRTNYGKIAMGEEQADKIFPDGLMSCRDGMTLHKEEAPLRFNRITEEKYPDFIDPDDKKNYEFAKYELAFLLVGTPLVREQDGLIVPEKNIYIKEYDLDYYIHYLVERRFVWKDTRLCIPIIFQRLTTDSLGFWEKPISRNVMDKPHLGFKERNPA